MQVFGRFSWILEAKKDLFFDFISKKSFYLCSRFRLKKAECV